MAAWRRDRIWKPSVGATAEVSPSVRAAVAVVLPELSRPLRFFFETRGGEEEAVKVRRHRSFLSSLSSCFYLFSLSLFSPFTTHTMSTRSSRSFCLTLRRTVSRPI